MPTPPCDEDYYGLLGVAPDATPDEIRSAYRRQVRLTHPDLRGPDADPTPFRRVQRAYEVLADPLERMRYDLITGLAHDADDSHFYRHSFNRLFYSLFSGLQAVLDTPPDTEKSRAG